MSLNQPIRNEFKPWLNMRVNNLQVDGILLPPSKFVTNISPFMVGPNFEYTTIQSALNAANATNPTNTNPAIIYVYPGLYEENLTLYGGIHIVCLDNSYIDDGNLAGAYELLPQAFSYYSGVQIKGAHTLNQSLTSGIGNLTQLNNLTFLSDGLGSIVFNCTQTDPSNAYPNTLFLISCKVFMVDGDTVFRGIVDNNLTISLYDTFIGPSPSSDFALFTVISFEVGDVMTQRTIGLFNIVGSTIMSGLNIVLPTNNSYGFYGEDSLIRVSFQSDGATPLQATVTFESCCCMGSFDGPFSNPVFIQCGLLVLKMQNCYETVLPYVNQFGTDLIQDCVGITTLYLMSCSYPSITKSNIISGGSVLGTTFISNFTTADGIINYSPGELWLNSSPVTIGSNSGTGIVNLKGCIKKTTSPLSIATVATSVTNVTGNGVTYRIIFNNEIVDLGNNYNPVNGLFTCPVDGVYRVACNILSGNSNLCTSGQLYITSSNSANTIPFGTCSPMGSGASGALNSSISCLMNCVQGELFGIDINFSGAGSNSTAVIGDATQPNASSFSVELVA